VLELHRNTYILIPTSQKAACGRCLNDLVDGANDRVDLLCALAFATTSISVRDFAYVEKSVGTGSEVRAITDQFVPGE
jgi:hypothetical protein